MLLPVRREAVREMKGTMFSEPIRKFTMPRRVREEKRPCVNRVNPTLYFANFFNEAYKSDVTIAQILWCLPNGKVDKGHR